MPSTLEGSRPPLIRIYPSFPTNKTWYLVESKSWNIEVRKLKNLAIARTFPEEFRFDVDPSTLRTKDGFPANSDPCRRSNLAIATPFAFFGLMLIRISTIGKGDLSIFQKAIDALDVIEFDKGSCRHNDNKESAPKSTESDDDSMCSFSSLDNTSSTNGSFSPSITSTPMVKTETLKRTISGSSSNISSVEDSLLRTPTKKRKIRTLAKKTVENINSMCQENNEDLAKALAYSCINDPLNQPSVARLTIRDVLQKVSEVKGPKKAFEMLTHKKTWESRLQCTRVPDWKALLFKIQGRVSDNGWQSLANLTNLCRTNRKGDTGILLSRNQVKAMKAMVFENIKDLFKVQKIPSKVVGYQVNLQSVIVWSIREMKLHGKATEDKISFNLKLDGRPFYGRQQVLVGIAPLKSPVLKNQSCKAVCPLAISNCKESRNDLKELLRDIIQQKKVLKLNGITVDGKKYGVTFTVTLDLKALYLLLVKEEDEEFVLGDKGTAIEFCFICEALRGCKCELGNMKVCKEHFNASKANIGGFKGIRDDLIFLFDEDLTSINICALHCEMRNTEQLMRSVGLLSHEIGALESYNEELKKYGPESFAKDRITIKLQQGQETRVEKNNVNVASFSGHTGKKFLANFESIVKAALPVDKLQERYQDPQVAREYILEKVRFCQEMIEYYQNLRRNGKYVRDFGTYQEEISIPGSAVGEKIEKKIDEWENELKEIEEKYIELHTSPSAEPMKKKRKSKMKKKEDSVKAVTKLDTTELSLYVSNLVVKYHVRVCKEYSEIAQKMRSKEYTLEQEHKIDKLDIKCKEWGFLLRELFGPMLGSGDYGHIVVEHVPMLMRVFRSLKQYTNQGLEAAHSYQKTIYSRSTSHDGAGYASSLEQIIINFYTEKMLFYRLCFREAQKCFTSGGKPKVFHFRGCGWKFKDSKPCSSWTIEDKKWISAMDSLFTDTFGADYLTYCFVDRVCTISEQVSCSYNHANWEDHYAEKVASIKLKPVRQGRRDNRKVKRLNLTKKVPTSKKVVGTNKRSSKGGKPTNAKISRSKIPSTETSSSCTFMPTRPLQSRCLYPDLQKCLSSNVLRGEQADMVLPPVKPNLSTNDIEVVSNPQVISDPLELPFRPSEDIVLASQTLLNKAKSNSNDGNTKVIAIKIANLGTVKENTLSLWSKACQAAEVKHQVVAERDWLKTLAGILPSLQLDAVQSVLLDSKSDRVLLQSCGMSMDTIDFASLACERYVTGFSINVICMKFVEEAHKQGTNSTIFLPSTTQIWITTDEKNIQSKLRLYAKSTNPQLLRKILIPIHMQQCHWGLMYLDLPKQQLFFDDGLHWKPPSDLPAIARNVLKGLRVLFPQVNSMAIANWNLKAKRFGMPSQPKVGEGSGSCGIGVILSARDIVHSPEPENPSFQWNFQKMGSHRIALMHKVTTWL